MLQLVPSYCSRRLCVVVPLSITRVAQHNVADEQLTWIRRLFSVVFAAGKMLQVPL